MIGVEADLACRTFPPRGIARVDALRFNAAVRNDLVDVTAFVSQLEGAETVTPAYEVVDRYAREGWIPELVELRRAIEASCNVDGDPRWTYESAVRSYIPAQKLTAWPPTSTMSSRPANLASTRVVFSYVSGGAT